jgi:hypothetical protein
MTTTIKCPHCGEVINPAKLLRSIPSEKRSATARENGKKGGRPRKKKDTTEGEK